ncbi:hypothetical protein, partial [Anaplasma capra]|uniref:hypothetical protein n=1 Tax=Anaplasma capra TaxID=1562740 RepID=UPI0021D611FD
MSELDGDGDVFQLATHSVQELSSKIGRVIAREGTDDTVTKTLKDLVTQVEELRKQNAELTMMLYEKITEESKKQTEALAAQKTELTQQITDKSSELGTQIAATTITPGRELAQETKVRAAQGAALDQKIEKEAKA